MRRAAPLVLLVAGCAGAFPAPEPPRADVQKVALAGADRAFVDEQIEAGRLVFLRDGAVVRGCATKAAWTRAQPRRVAAVAANDDACPDATHVALSIDVEGATIAPIARPAGLFADAKKVTFVSAIGSTWSVEGLCTVPCDAWLLPGVGVNVVEAPPGERSAWSNSDASRVGICTRRRRVWPVALSTWFIVVGIGAAALSTVATVSLANGDGARANGSSASAVGKSAGDKAAGLIVLPLLGAAGLGVAGWGTYELFPREIVVAESDCAP